MSKILELAEEPDMAGECRRVNMVGASQAIIIRAWQGLVKSKCILDFNEALHFLRGDHGLTENKLTAQPGAASGRGNGAAMTTRKLNYALQSRQCGPDCHQLNVAWQWTVDRIRGFSSIKMWAIVPISALPARALAHASRQ